MTHRCPGPCCGVTLTPYQLCAECRGLIAFSVALPPVKSCAGRMEWTDELVASIVAEYKAGTGAAWLAAHYGASTDTVLRRLREAGVTIRRRGRRKAVA